MTGCLFAQISFSNNIMWELTHGSWQIFSAQQAMGRYFVKTSTRLCCILRYHEKQNAHCRSQSGTVNSISRQGMAHQKFIYIVKSKLSVILWSVANLNPFHGSHCRTWTMETNTKITGVTLMPVVLLGETRQLHPLQAGHIFFYTPLCIQHQTSLWSICSVANTYGQYQMLWSESALTPIHDPLGQ